MPRPLLCQARKRNYSHAHNGWTPLTAKQPTPTSTQSQPTRCTSTSDLPSPSINIRLHKASQVHSRISFLIVLFLIFLKFVFVFFCARPAININGAVKVLRCPISVVNLLLSSRKGSLSHVEGSAAVWHPSNWPYLWRGNECNSTAIRLQQQFEVVLFFTCEYFNEPL
eukprot:TRINITY_DN66489_c9_g4_i3.p2 TRINITY_DN66489_c9_g4~~TRINITY_DN66489_c9_g4_i3.p2  ORF type:complete len:168 (-),score=5.76 TRINITY_DN66489_c9_g4_i3:180-683(-)